MFGRREWEVAPGQQFKVARILRQLEREHFEDTGRRPFVTDDDHPQGALAWIDSKDGRIVIFSGERYGPAARVEELFHYRQLKARGLLGVTEDDIGKEIIHEMEVEVETMLRNAGFQPRR